MKYKAEAKTTNIISNDNKVPMLVLYNWPLMWLSVSLLLLFLGCMRHN